MARNALLVLLVAAVAAGTVFASGGAEAATSAKEETVMIWGWDNSDLSKKTYAAFHDKYPKYTIETTIVANKDMEQKLQTALASGADVPDVAWIEATYRGNILALDIWEDISKPPFNYDVKNVPDYLIPLETTPKGVYVGPEVPSIGGMAFKRALTKEYLGTDDQMALQKMFPTWDDFIIKGREIAQKSGGKVFSLTSPWNALIFFRQQSNTPFVIGDKLNLKAAATPILQRIIDMKKAGMLDTYAAGSPVENASYTDNTHIFYPCANWSVTFTIKRNDPNGSGRWGFMIPPGGGFPMGGTVQGVAKKAKHKMGAVTFLKYRYGSIDGATMLRDWQGYFAPMKNLYVDDKFYSKEDPYFGGQNLQRIFALDILAKIKDPRLPTKYDQQVNDDGFNLALGQINTGATVTAAGLVQAMEDDLIKRNPGLKRD